MAPLMDLPEVTRRRATLRASVRGWGRRGAPRPRFPYRLTAASPTRGPPCSYRKLAIPHWAGPPPAVPAVSVSPGPPLRVRCRSGVPGHWRARAAALSPRPGRPGKSSRPAPAGRRSASRGCVMACSDQFLRR